MPMNRHDVVNLIEKSLNDRPQRAVPPKGKQKLRFFFKRTDDSQIQLQELLLLERENPEGFSWLLFNEEGQCFYVFPHAVARQVLTEIPKCFPANENRAKADPARLVAAKWPNLKVRHPSGLLSSGTSSVSVAQFINDTAAFERHILPHWSLLDESLPSDAFPVEACPNCRKRTLPIHKGFAQADRHCTHRLCRLWIRGEGHPPEERGTYRYDDALNTWVSWDNRPFTRPRRTKSMAMKTGSTP